MTADMIPLDRSLIEEALEESLSTERTCAECGKAFPKKRAGARFCSKQCKNDYTNRELKRGSVLLKAAMHWRSLSQSKDPDDRKDGGAYFSMMSTMLDRFRKEDREAGRKPPTRPEVEL